jgi:tetratricopeptide (TPR) repeat protein
VHKHQESYAAAATAYNKAFALDEENGEYGLAQGKMLKKSEQYADAETVLRKVIEIDKQAEYVYTELGDVLRALNKDDEALRTYMKAQTIHPGDLMAHAGAALVYEKKDDIKHALDEWSTYIRMDCCSDYSKTVARKKVETLGKGDGEADDDAGDEESKD